MTLFKNIAVSIAGVLWVAAVHSQPLNYSNLRTKKIPAASNSFDSLSIVPHTFFIKGIDTSYYSIDEVNARLYWKAIPATDTIEVVYRVFPYRLNQVARRFTYDSVMNNFIAQPAIFNSNKKPGTGSLFNFGNINYNGSFGRALSFGNNQDVVVNSQFNLQLNGLIGDSIEVAAAITDNNIPIQPDGTTQQLNEFDRILLQFRKGGWEVNLGDIDIRQNRSYFLNFYKRLQGISYSNNSIVAKNTTNKLLVSGAIAKGKFTRNIFQGQEGNQGPYRLTGANNELFFIVLAGTERVYIDGELMQRGEDQDYVINYNTAEITFTPRRMITKDKRIQVEFEYADRNFLNSMLYVNNATSINKKLTLTVAAYSNADAKSSPINQTLDQKQRQFLNSIGDSIQKAFYPAASIDTFSSGKILYARRDTAYPGGRDSIYIFSNNKDSARYSLNFIEVGTGNGNYVPDFNGANGKVYRWVQPVNGVLQGNFEPATFLVTPKKQQLITVGSVYAINSKTSIQTEWAASDYDVNTFSAKDKKDDKGYAARMILTRTDRIKTAKNKPLQLNSNLGYEWVNERFRPLERLRSVEFYRDWGLELQPPPATEHLPWMSLQLTDSAGTSVQYVLSGYLRSDNYAGFRHTVIHQQKIKGWQFNNVFNYTKFSALNNKGFFLRPVADVSKTFSRFHNYVIGASYALEDNEVRYKIKDSLSPGSFSFSTISAYIKSNEAKNNKWSLTYFTRSDKLPSENKLTTTDRSQNINLMTELRSGIHHQLRLNVTYRNLTIVNQTLTTQKPDNSLLGRVEYGLNKWKGFVVGNVLYELGAGQEQRRDFSYIEVPPGRGEFAWNDYNLDGIPQVNEFEVAVFQDQAKYIRVFTPTNQFIKANYTQFNYSINLNPGAIASSIKSKRLRDLLVRFSLQSSLQIAKKEISSGKIIFDPFTSNINDTSLISLNNVAGNTLSFNRMSQKWGADLSRTVNYNKSLLTYGIESRRLKEWTLRTRWNLTRQYAIDLVQKAGANSLLTPKFSNRNYDLQTITSEPRFTFTRGTTYRLQASYQYRRKQNRQVYGGEKSTNNSLNLEGKYNAVNNTSISGKFTFSNIAYNGATNSTISYIMLDGLLPGKNYLWNVDVTKRLNNNLELSFQYEGRKPAETHTIHIGRASLRAIL